MPSPALSGRPDTGITVIVNGVPQWVPIGTTLLDLLDHRLHDHSSHPGPRAYLAPWNVENRSHSAAHRRALADVRAQAAPRRTARPTGLKPGAASPLCASNSCLETINGNDPASPAGLGCSSMSPADGPLWATNATFCFYHHPESAAGSITMPPVVRGRTPLLPNPAAPLECCSALAGVATMVTCCWMEPTWDTPPRELLPTACGFARPNALGFRSLEGRCAWARRSGDRIHPGGRPLG